MKISYINYKVWWKKLRLKTKTYGGKIEKVCTAFSLKTFLRKTLKRLPFKSFSSQNSQRKQLTENPVRKLVHQFAFKKQFRYVKMCFCQTVLKFHFSTNFSVFVHGVARVPQDKNDEMTMDQTGDILKN